MSVATLKTEPDRHAIVVPADCTCGACGPTWARRRGKSRKFSEPVTLEYALEHESPAVRAGMVDEHREFLVALTGKARNAYHQLPLADPDTGLSLMEFAGELAYVLQPEASRDELPPDLVAACETAITTATHVAADLLAGMIDTMRELSAVLPSLSQSSRGAWR